MRNPNGLRVVALIAPPLFLLSLPFLIVILERISSSLFNSQLVLGSHGITRFYAHTATEAIKIHVLINVAPALGILGICVLAFFVAAIGACGIWELRRVEGTARRQRVWAWTVLGANLAAVAGSIAVLAWASSVQGREGWRSRADVDTVSGQRWTRETWVCQIDKWMPEESWAGTACGVAKATRWMLLSLAVSAILTMGSTWILIRERGGFAWLTGGRGRYAAFDDTYGMKPQQNSGRAFNERPAAPSS